jgi:hypothetical protein
MNKSEGVFAFQFLSDNSPLTNTAAPFPFQVVRYTPDTESEAFQTIIPGQLNNDGSFEYGGGRKGMLTASGITWNDRVMWTRVTRMPNQNPDILDLDVIRAQARLDSETLMNDVYRTNYLY